MQVKIENPVVQNVRVGENCNKSDITWQTLAGMFFLQIPFSIPRKRA